RVAASEHSGRLAWLEKVVSTEQALPPEIAALSRAVADRYGGVLADVLRLAVPPRHARVEAEAAGANDGAVATDVDIDIGHGSWERYPRGPAFLRALGEG